MHGHGDQAYEDDQCTTRIGALIIIVGIGNRRLAVGVTVIAHVGASLC